MILKNAPVFGEDQKFHKRDLYIVGDRIANSPQADDSEEIDLSDCYLVPGFVDIHLHGAIGYDFCDAELESFQKIAEYELRHGVTAICPTTMSLDEKRLKSVCTTFDLASEHQKNHQARLLGIHMEGPFLNLQKAGAQNPSYIREFDLDFLKRVCGGNYNKIKLITIAPEVHDAKSFVSYYKDKVHISMGHSNASYELADQMMKQGIKHVTHLYNGMSEIHHRDPGIYGAALDNQDVFVELICDGVHVHPAMIRNAYRLFGANRIILISDSMEATGLADGEYELGGQPVYKTGTKATLQDGTLAGSVSNLFQCFQKALLAGIPVEDALSMVTANPAKSIEMETEVGYIREGATADLLILNKDYSLREVIKNGKVVK